MRSAKRTAFSSGIVILLLSISVLLGYITDWLWTHWEKQYYPVDFSQEIFSSAETYDLDPYIICALIKELSDFQSNHVSEEKRIGLMQLSEETFRILTEEHLGENLNSGLLYEPATNIRYGAYYLLYLTTCYESQEAIFAAYLCGREKVDGWYRDWQLNADFESAEFVIPDQETREKVAKIQRTIDKYKKLYDEKGEVLS